jgi:hypothetical protein
VVAILSSLVMLASSSRTLLLLLLLVDSVFELVSGEDKARMDAAKMQGDIVRKQLEKTTPSEEENAVTSVNVQRNTPTSASASTQLETGNAQSTAAAAAAAAAAGGGGGVKPDVTPTQSSASSQPLWKSSSFTPFAKNPEKQKRYELYLETLKQGKTCKLHLNRLFVDKLCVE